MNADETEEKPKETSKPLLGLPLTKTGLMV
jgi:hypothetical protein